MNFHDKRKEKQLYGPPHGKDLFIFTFFASLSFSTIPLEERTVKTAGPDALSPNHGPNTHESVLGQQQCTEGRLNPLIQHLSLVLSMTIHNF